MVSKKGDECIYTVMVDIVNLCASRHVLSLMSKTCVQCASLR